MAFIIGFVGAKTSGKTTAANIIHEFIPTLQERAFADNLKNACSIVFGLKREQFDRQDMKEVLFETPKILTLEAAVKLLNFFNINNTDSVLRLSASNLVGMELKTPRAIAQIVGTELLRGVGDDLVHCKNLDIPENGYVVVTDLRFQNEFDYLSGLKNHSFLPIYIERKEAESFVNENSHPSEKGVLDLKKHCVVVDNNNSILNLEFQLKMIIDTKIFKYKDI